MSDVKHFDPETVVESAVRLFWRQGIASTGIQDIVSATGVNRSSLYATFGGKKELYLAALRRYLDQISAPVFQRLAADDQGLPAIADFFARLVEVRCHGEHARWGCMISNAHAGEENDDQDVQQVLHLHHDQLRAALHVALEHARSLDQLRPEIDPASTADLLALLAYGVNLRSRAGADPAALAATISSTLTSVARRPEEAAP